MNIRLAEPLHASFALHNLVALCFVADAFIERVQKAPEGEDSFDIGILRRIEAACNRIEPSREAPELLQSLGILDVFSYLRQGISGNPLEAATHNPASSYFSYISQLNQVVMMGTQLYHDALVPQHHKYIAHQIALLYQCLNALQGDTKPVRKLIEARFDDVKIKTESKSPILDIDLSEWLQEITWLCREEIRSFPPYIHKRLWPVLSLCEQ